MQQTGEAKGEYGLPCEQQGVSVKQAEEGDGRRPSEMCYHGRSLATGDEERHQLKQGTSEYEKGAANPRRWHGRVQLCSRMSAAT